MTRAPLRTILLLSSTLVVSSAPEAQPITQRMPANGAISAQQSPADPLSIGQTLGLLATPGYAVSIKCDGVTDDAPAINAALARFSYLRPLGIQDLHLQGPVCLIGSTISAPKWSGVGLFGNGAGNGGRSATTLKWVGAPNGTMVSITSPGDGYFTGGMRLGDINLDGNHTASIGLKIRALAFSHIGLVQVENTTGIGVDIDSNGDVPGVVNNGTQLNLFDGFLITQTDPGAKGLVLGRGADVVHTADVNGDPNSNVFGTMNVVTAGGDGVVCGAADANTFLYLRLQGPSGSGTVGSGPAVGLRLEGAVDPTDTGWQNCRYNNFLHAQIFGRLVSENGVARKGVNVAPATNNILRGVGVGDSFTLLDLTNAGSTRSRAVGNGADATNNNLIETDQGATTGAKSMTATGLVQGGRVVAKGGGAQLTAFDRAQNGDSFNVYEQSFITHLSDSGGGAAADIPSLGVRAHDQLTLGGATVTSPVLFQAPAGVTFPIVLGNPQPPPRGSPGVYFTARVGNTCQLSVIVSGGAVTGLASSYACP